MTAERTPNTAKRANGRLRAAERPCKANGCPERRYVAPSGWVSGYCRAHEAEESRTRYVRRRSSAIPYVRQVGPKAERRCLGPLNGGPPCDKPRRIGPNGKAGERCEEHAADAQIVWHRGHNPDIEEHPR